MSQISQKKTLIEMIKIVLMIGRTQGVGYLDLLEKLKLKML